MAKYINADEFIQEYNRIDLKPYINKGYAQQIDGYEMWEKWKIEFDQNVRQIVARLLTEREDEDKFIARIKDIPIMPMPSADVVEVKHGEWEGTVCSNCGASVSNYYDCDFCPKCGANMQDNPHWINHTEYGVTTYVTDKDVECSECGHRQPKLFDMNFCPNCGADMRERKETE